MDDVSTPTLIGMCVLVFGLPFAVLLLLFS
jgi:hypothetical protein